MYLSSVALGYWLDIPYVFPHNNWDAATALVFGKLRGSSLRVLLQVCII